LKPQYVAPTGAEGPGSETHLRRLLEQFGDADATVMTDRISIGTAETRIAHGLNAVPSGWIAVAPSDLATVCQTKSPDNGYLYLKASVAITARIMAF